MILTISLNFGRPTYMQDFFRISIILARPSMTDSISSVSFSCLFPLVVIEMRSAIPGNICKFPFINETLGFLYPILEYPLIHHQGIICHSTGSWP